MTATNAKIAQKLEAIVVTIEMLIGKAREVSTTSFENSMNSTKVQAAKDKLDVVDAKVSEWHALMQEASATSSDSDVAYRSGGGGGK